MCNLSFVLFKAILLKACVTIQRCLHFQAIFRALHFELFGEPQAQSSEQTLHPCLLPSASCVLTLPCQTGTPPFALLLYCLSVPSLSQHSGSAGQGQRIDSLNLGDMQHQFCPFQSNPIERLCDYSKMLPFSSHFQSPSF